MNRPKLRQGTLLTAAPGPPGCTEGTCSRTAEELVETVVPTRGRAVHSVAQESEYEHNYVAGEIRPAVHPSARRNLTVTKATKSDGSSVGPCSD